MRLLWLAVLSVAVAVAAGREARADCFVWMYYGTQYPTGSSIGDAIVSYENGLNNQVNLGNGNVSDTYTNSPGADVPGAPTAAGQTTSGKFTDLQGLQTQWGQAAVSQAGSCPPPSSCSAGRTDDINPAGNTVQAEGSSACASNNCSYTMGPAASLRTVVAMVGGQQAVTQTAVQSGASCNFAASSAGAAPVAAAVLSQVDNNAPVTDCQSGGGTVACATQTASGTYCGTYNGDAVCVGQVAPGTCTAYSSGGVACTVPSGQTSVQSPPGPNSGTAGVAAMPDMTVSSSATVGGVTTATPTDYYKPSTVAGSTTPVQTTGSGATGAANGTGAAGTGTGIGTGSGSGACPAGQTCNGASDSISGGSTCASAPVCTDTDPVQCGIANQDWLIRCEGTSEADLGTAIGDVPGIAASAAGDFSTPTTESGPFNSASATCPAPVTVTVLGNTLSIDFWTNLCNFASVISAAVMVVAYLFAARVMFTAVAGAPVGSN